MVKYILKTQGRKCQFITLCKLLKPLHGGWKTFFSEFEWQFNSPAEKVLLS